MRLQVKLEIGHKASCRSEPTVEGFTHDWTVFVRGLDGKDISYFVEKVVFHLHESFPRPKRAVKEAPFKVDEHGYGSFELKIEVYFKSKDEPRKVMFLYDLFLPLVGYPPVTNVRTEALTFTYPSDDFMKKLLKGGAIATALESADGVSNGVSNGHLNHPEKPAKEHVAQKSFTLPDGEKNKKKIKNKPSVPTGLKRSPGHDTNIDGTAKKKKRLSDSSSTKKKTEPVAAVTSEVKDLKIKFKPIPPRELERSKEVEKVHHKERKEHKDKTKPHSSKTKEVRTPVEQASTDVKAMAATTEHHKVKLKRDEVEKKHSEKKEKKEKSKKEKKHKVEKLKIKKLEEAELKKEERKVDLKKGKEGSEKKVSKEEKKEKDKKAVNKVTIRRSSGDSWASGLMADVVSKNKALGKLLSELSDDDETEMNVLPTFKTEPTPVPSKIPQKDLKSINTTEKNSTPFTKQTITNKDSKPQSEGGSSHQRNETSTTQVDGKEKTDTKTSSPMKSVDKNGVNNNRLSKEELYDLFESINNCQDSDFLQKVVDVIETTGLYTMSEKTLEFDLCTLEKSTLRKMQKCLGLR